MADRRRRRFRPRAREAAPPPSRDAVEAPAFARLGRVALLLILLIGYWLGRIVTFLPSDGLRLVDLAVALLSALLLAIWYRRRARRYLRVRDEAIREQVRRAREQSDD